MDKIKPDRIQKSKDAIMKKYGVNSFPETKGFYEKVKKTKLKKYGNENYNNLEGIKKTLNERYNVSSVGELNSKVAIQNKSKETKKRKYNDENYNNRKLAKKTTQIKYGTDHHLHVQSILDKQIKTNLEKNGTEYNILTKKARKNLKKHNQIKYGSNFYFESEKYLIKTKDIKLEKIKEICNNNNLHFNENDYIKLREKNKNHIKYIKYKITCLTCSHVFESVLSDTPLCRKCHPYSSCPKQHLELREFLEQNQISFDENNRSLIHPYELDFYLKDFNLAIELNGNYFHAENAFGKDKNYHLNKTKLSLDKNIHLIHIFEDEWINKKNILKSKILNLCKKTPNKIFARKCEIKEVNYKEKLEFLNQNHLQGNDVSSYNIGLYYNNSLVSIMTFCKLRKALGFTRNKNENILEISRFCSLLNHNVIGAFEKLLNYKIKSDLTINKIITYADCRFSGVCPEKTVYFKSGFEFIHHTKPNYFYVFKNNYLNRFHRFGFNKQNLLKKFPNNSDKNQTEWEIAQQNNMDRIWDCGSLKFQIIVS